MKNDKKLKRWAIIALTLLLAVIGLTSFTQTVGVSDQAGFVPQVMLHIYKNSTAAASLFQIANQEVGNGAGEGFTFDVDATFNISMNNRANTYLAFKTNASERLRLLSTGQISINGAPLGTMQAGDLFDIYESGAVYYWGLNSYNSGTSGGAGFWQNMTNTNGFNAMEGVTNYNGNAFVPSGVFGLAIDAGGTGTAIGTSGVTNSTNTGSYGVYAQNPFANSANHYGLYVFGRAYSTANWYIPSDSILKTNVTIINNALAKIMKLNAIEYDFDKKYKDFVSNDEKQVGFLAQEVERVFPNTDIVSSVTLVSKITGSTKSITSRKTMESKAVAYSDFIPYIIEAMQEQQRIIENLEKINTDLQKRIKVLETK